MPRVNLHRLRRSMRHHLRVRKFGWLLRSHERHPETIRTGTLAAQEYPRGQDAPMTVHQAHADGLQLQAGGGRGASEDYSPGNPPELIVSRLPPRQRHLRADRSAGLVGRREQIVHAGRD